VVSDFGNNGGLMIGVELTDWRARMDGIAVETTLNGVVVGAGGAPSLGGGAMESVRFLLGHCAGRGRPLSTGTLVSTGAVTGVHRAQIGDRFACVFADAGVISGTVVRAEA
jgi:2-keto-4-pentenoate hydratase